MFVEEAFTLQNMELIRKEHNKVKENYDLIRELMLEIEKQTGFIEVSKSESFASYSDDEIRYHVIRLIEEGLLEGEIRITKGKPAYIIKGLSPAGRDFIDDINAN